MIGTGSSGGVEAEALRSAVRRRARAREAKKSLPARVVKPGPRARATTEKRTRLGSVARRASTSTRPGRRSRPVASLRPAAIEPSFRLSDEEVKAYYPLVRQVVQRMLPRKPPEVATEDLLSWGAVGLLDAMRKYDRKREASFSTYAQYRIRGSILDYLRRCDWLPRSVRQRSHDVEIAITELEHRLGRPPSPDEVASALGVTIEQYSQTLSSCGSISIIPTAELSFGRGEESLTGDEILSDDAESGPMTQLLRKERVEILARAIEQLPEKERIVVSFYYFEGLTMREVAIALHLTEGRISQLHSQAMPRLRTALCELQVEQDLIG